jgi:hypothetical protein
LGHGSGLVRRSSTCPMSSFVLRGAAVKSKLRWSVPCGNDDGQLVDGGGLGGGKPSIFLFRSSSSKSELSFIGVCDRLLTFGQVDRWVCPM